MNFEDLTTKDDLSKLKNELAQMLQEFTEQVKSNSPNGTVINRNPKLRTKEAASYLGISSSQLYKLAREKVIKSYKYHEGAKASVKAGVVYWLKKDLDDYERNHLVEA